MRIIKSKTRKPSDKQVLIEVLAFLAALLETTNKFLPKQIELLTKSQKWSKLFDSTAKEVDFLENCVEGLDARSTAEIFVLLNTKVPALMNDMTSLSDKKLPGEGNRMVADIDITVKKLKNLTKRLGK